MKRKIIVNNKEFTMPKMSIDTYTEYLELAEVIDAKQRYSKQDIEATTPISGCRPCVIMNL